MPVTVLQSTRAHSFDGERGIASFRLFFERFDVSFSFSSFIFLIYSIGFFVKEERRKKRTVTESSFGVFVLE